MKKLIYTSLLLVSVALTFSSCRKVETEPIERITDELVWDEMDVNGTVAQFFLNNIYNYLPDGYNRIGGDYLDVGSGDALPSRNTSAAIFLLNGQVSAINNPDGFWATPYAGIRRSNIFLKNIGRVPSNASTSLNRQYWRAEARFLRTMLYFELVKRYGGVPLIGDTIFNFNDNLQLKRNTYEQCVNYIVSECDAVKDSLRKDIPTATTDNDWGRITKGAALALKGRMLLYAASPLFNGGITSSNAELKSLMGYPTADATRWQKALAAIEEFNTYNASLPATNRFALHSSYITLFTTRKNAEVILAKQRGNSQDIELNNAPIGYISQNQNSLGLTSPTQNFVDAYPMANGLGIAEAGSGYDATNPYAGRDPRFAVSVFHNNLKWLNRNVETFEGGKDKPGGSKVQTRTGYYLRKFMADFTSATAYSNQTHNFIIFRYAEILLNYAEALNEVGRTEDAVTQIGLIRKRAGIAAGANNRYGIKAGITQLDMQQLIMNERRIELAFEEHRFWDIRRWKTAEQVLNAPLEGMVITKNTNGSFSYQKNTAFNPVFSAKMYSMPIPFDEVSKNRALLQNEGW